MTRKQVILFLLLVTAAVTSWLTIGHGFAAETSSRQTSDVEALKSLSSLHPIDVHVHVFKADPAFQTMLDQLNLKLIDILVMDDTLSYRQKLQPQIDEALKLVQSSKGHVALCTTFDPYKFNDPSFPKE